MDRDGFVEFVQRSFVERKTKGSMVMIRSRSAEITECDCAIRARGLYNQLAGQRYTSLSLRTNQAISCLRSAIHGLSANLYLAHFAKYARSMDCARNPWIVA